MPPSCRSWSPASNQVDAGDGKNSPASTTLTQQTLHKPFDGVDQETKDRIMFGTFNELFSRRAAATCPRYRSWIAHLGNVRRITRLATTRARAAG